MRLQRHLLWWPGYMESASLRSRWHSKLPSFFGYFFIMKCFIHAKFYKSSCKGYFLSSLPSVYFQSFLPGTLQEGELFLLSLSPHPQNIVERTSALPRDPRALTVSITSSGSVQTQPVSSLSPPGGLSGHRHPESWSPDVWFHICTDFSGTA